MYSTNISYATNTSIGNPTTDSSTAIINNNATTDSNTAINNIIAT